MLMQIYNGKEQTEKGKLQNIQFEEQTNTRKWNGVKSCKNINRLEKSLIFNGKKGVVISVQDSTQINFQLVKRN